MSGHNGDRENTPGAKVFLIALAASVISSVITIAVHDVFFAQKIVAIDLADRIASQREDYAAGRITAGELVENIDRLLKHMQQKAKGEVLVLEEAIAGDVKHYDLGAAVADEEDDRER